MRNGIRLRLTDYVVLGGYGQEYIETIPVGGSFTTRGQVTRYQSRLAEPMRAQGFNRVVARPEGRATEGTKAVFRLIGHGNGYGHPASPFGLRRDKRE